MNLFQEKLIEWYELNKRDLPWRNTKNPYFIWLSEIILQQTKVDQGLKYYLHFIETYPKIEDLAKADLQVVLKSWEGLGYYSRARNLHATSKVVVEKYNGKFPSTYLEMIQLKGIGEYTASAISSFAFNGFHAVLDGNVFRVLSRIFDIEEAIDSSKGKKIFRALANDILPKENTNTYNQAIMEFGALFCTPNKPNCEHCFIHENCLSFQNKTVAYRPVKQTKQIIKKRYFNYLVFLNDKNVYIKKRIENDIWSNLYEFPLIEKESLESNNEKMVQKEIFEKFGIKPDLIIPFKKHILSHQHIFANFYIFKEKNSKNAFPVSFLKIPITNLDEYPFPKLILNFKEEYNQIIL